MGNAFACMPRKEQRGAALVSRSKRMGSARSARGGPKLTPAEEELLHRQALAMAIHQHLDAGGSMSRRIDAGASLSRRMGPGSTSSRRRGDLPDSVTNAKPVRLLLPTFFFSLPISLACFLQPCPAFLRSKSDLSVINVTLELYILVLPYFSVYGQLCQASVIHSIWSFAICA